MNYKQKAVELVNKFEEIIYPMLTKPTRQLAKIHAIVCVNQIIESLKITTGYMTLKRSDVQELDSDFKFWERVISEINKL